MQKVLLFFLVAVLGCVSVVSFAQSGGASFSGKVKSEIGGFEFPDGTIQTRAVDADLVDQLAATVSEPATIRPFAMFRSLNFDTFDAWYDCNSGVPIDLNLFYTSGVACLDLNLGDPGGVAESDVIVLESATLTITNFDFRSSQEELLDLPWATSLNWEDGQTITAPLLMSALRPVRSQYEADRIVNCEVPPGEPCDITQTFWDLRLLQPVGALQRLSNQLSGTKQLNYYIKNAGPLSLTVRTSVTALTQAGEPKDLSLAVQLGLYGQVFAVEQGSQLSN
jgi:hypothetical protein